MSESATNPPEGDRHDSPGVNPVDTATMLAARYGLHRPQRRWPLLISVTVSAISLVGVLIWAALSSVNPAIDGRLQSFEVLSDTAVRTSFLVRTGADLSESGICVVRAQDRQRIDVGYALVSVAPTAGRDVVVDYTLTTRKPAHVVELLGCGIGDGIPAGVPQPQFPPGVRAPDQIAPGRAP